MDVAVFAHREIRPVGGDDVRHRDGIAGLGLVEIVAAIVDADVQPVLVEASCGAESAS